MSRLYRSMKERDDGLPELGPSARCLGVRPHIDVSAVQGTDVVSPRTGGLSVSPNDPMNLPYFRRPVQYQGTGSDPVWSIDELELQADLQFRLDPNKSGHGIIEPALMMTLDELQEALAKTQSLWRKE